MKAPTQTGWIYWWWVDTGLHGPFVKTTWMTRRCSAKHITAYDLENGWKVGKVHRLKVSIEAKP